jgi:hypothetical protein
MINFMAMADDSSNDSDRSPVRELVEDDEVERKPFSDLKSGTVSRSKSSSITAENIQNKMAKAAKNGKGNKGNKKPAVFFNNVASSSLTQKHNRLTYKNVKELEEKIE